MIGTPFKHTAHLAVRLPLIGIGRAVNARCLIAGQKRRPAAPSPHGDSTFHAPFTIDREK
jgi:hypothetical protein